MTFWCNGVQKVETTQPTRKQASNSEADGVTCTKRKRVSTGSKAEQVAEIKSELKQMYGGKYNELQYRLWAEILVAGVYTDRGPSTLLNACKRSQSKICCKPEQQQNPYAHCKSDAVSRDTSYKNIKHKKDLIFYPDFAVKQSVAVFA